METRSRHLKHFKYAVNQLDGAALLPLPAQLQLRLLLSWPQPESSGSHLGAGRLRVPWGPRDRGRSPGCCFPQTGAQTLPGHLVMCNLHTHKASTTSRGAVAPSWCHITCAMGMKVQVAGEAGRGRAAPAGSQATAGGGLWKVTPRAFSAAPGIHSCSKR